MDKILIMSQKETFKAIVNDQFEFEEVDGSLDIQPDADGRFHVLKGGKSYKAELVRADFYTKTFTLKVNGISYEVTLEDEYDQLVKRLGLSIAEAAQVRNILAPMPGLVLEVSVKAGQEVEAGSPLIILEAMKMENIIKSPGEGVVKAVNVKQGEAVEKGYLLIEME
jgi:biotin carboxyl carrier protein